MRRFFFASNARICEVNLQNFIEIIKTWTFLGICVGVCVFMLRISSSCATHGTWNNDKSKRRLFAARKSVQVTAANKVLTTLLETFPFNLFTATSRLSISGTQYQQQLCKCVLYGDVCVCRTLVFFMLGSIKHLLSPDYSSKYMLAFIRSLTCVPLCCCHFCWTPTQNMHAFDAFVVTRVKKIFSRIWSLDQWSPRHLSRIVWSGRFEKYITIT